MVLSQAAAAASMAVPYQVPAFNYNQVASQVNQAFNAFRTSYNNELSGFVSRSGTTPGQLQAFNTQQAGLLAQQLQGALASVPGAAAALAPFVLGGVNGSGGASMVAALNAIPGDTGSDGGPSPLYGAVGNAAINSAQLAANNVLSAYAWGLGVGAASHGSANPPVSSDYGPLASTINGAFDTFRTGYDDAVGNVLSGSATSAVFQGATTHEAANLVQVLQTSLNDLPGASSGLGPFLAAQVDGNYGGALLTTLNAFSANIGSNGAADSLASLAAADTINSAQLAANDIASAFTWGLNQGLAYANLNAAGGAGGGATATQTAIAGATSAAYPTTVQNTFANDVRSALFANPSPGINGSVSRSADLAAFRRGMGLATIVLQTTTTSAASSGSIPSLVRSTPVSPLIHTGTSSGGVVGLTTPITITSASGTLAGSRSMAVGGGLNGTSFGSGAGVGTLAQSGSEAGTGVGLSGTPFGYGSVGTALGNLIGTTGATYGFGAGVRQA